MKQLASYATLTLLSVSVMALVAVPLKAVDNDPQTPYIQTVNPASAKAGAVITVDGSNLGQSLVSEIYLTLGKTDVKLAVTSQKATQIMAKLPVDIEPGRYRLMILTAGLTPRFIEQPVRLNVQ